MVVALQRLKAPEVAPVIELLKLVRSQTLESMASVGDEVQFRRFQGRAELAKELLDLVDQADVLVAKFNRQASR